MSRLNVPPLPAPSNGGTLSQASLELFWRDGWDIEVKLDGWRAVILQNGEVVTREGVRLDTFAPLPAHIPFIDGEWYERRFVAFDAPIQGDLTRRRVTLADLGLPLVDRILTLSALPDDAEGVVLKMRDAAYPCRALTRHWIKLRRPGRWTGAGATRNPRIPR